MDQACVSEVSCEQLLQGRTIKHIKKITYVEKGLVHVGLQAPDPEGTDASAHRHRDFVTGYRAFSITNQTYGKPECSLCMSLTAM